MEEAIPRTHYRNRRPRGAEKVEMEIAQQRLAYLNPSDTIAPYIQGGREHPDAQLREDDRDDALGETDHPKQHHTMCPP